MWDIRVAEYSAISQPISGLGLGVTAPFMNAAFVISGLLIIAGAVGIFHSISELSARARWTCTVLLALHGLGAVTDGIFTLESFFPHFLGFLLALTPILSFLVIGVLLRRVRGWRRFGTWLLLGSPFTLALAVVYFASFDPAVARGGLGTAGLTQRILMVQLQSWFAALGWFAFSSPRRLGGRTG